MSDATPGAVFYGDAFPVYDGSGTGTLVSGLLNAAFTKQAYKNGATNAATVTVTEIGSSGWYEPSFTPSSAGRWFATITHSSYGTWLVEDVECASSSDPAILGSGTLQSASVLDATASSDDQAYRGALLIPTGGTGVGQGGKLIATYNGTTKAFTTYANFGTALDNTTAYVILAVSDYSRYVGDLLGTVASLGPGAITGSSISSGAITAAKIATDAIGAAQLAADAVTEIQSGLATASALSTVGTNVLARAVPGDAMTLADGAITAAKIQDTTLTAAKFADDAITASKIAANAIGSSQLAASAVSEIAAAVSVPSAATIAAAVADEALSGHTTAGSLGEALLRLRSTILHSGTLQSATVLAASASSDDQAYRGALLIPTGGTGVGQGGKLIATYNGTTKAFTTYASFGTSLDNTTTYVILAVSDYSRYVGDLLGTVAALGAGAISGSSISAGAITASKFGTGAITSTVLADDAITAAKIAADAIGASELAADAATEIADALLDRTSAIDGATPRDTLARIAASSHGKVSGMASGTPTFLGQDGSTSRIVATVDADGNRTAVTLP